MFDSIGRGRSENDTVRVTNVTFTFDLVGKILSSWLLGEAPTSMTFDSASRIVTMIQGASLTSYVHDSAGNRIIDNAVSAGGITTNTFNGANRLVQKQYPSGGISTYAYSGDGLRRNLQDTGAPFTFTVWDGTDYLQERS